MGRIAKLIKTAIDNYIEQTVAAYLGANITALTYAPSGDDSPPLENDRIALIKIDGSGAFAAIGVLSESQGANPGERIIYSRDKDGEVQAAIRLLNDGNVEIEVIGDGRISAKDADGNTIETTDDGITLTDKDGAKVEMAGKITLTSKKGASMELDDKVEIKDKKGGKIEMDGKITIQGLAGKMEAT